MFRRTLEVEYITDSNEDITHCAIDTLSAFSSPEFLALHEIPLLLVLDLARTDEIVHVFRPCRPLIGAKRR